MDAPEVVEQLEELEDAVYNAIAGDAESPAALTTLWPELLDLLPVVTKPEPIGVSEGYDRAIRPGSDAAEYGKLHPSR